MTNLKTMCGNWFKKNIIDKIKKLEITKLLISKSTIKKLESKVEEQEKEIKALKDKIRIINLERGRIAKQEQTAKTFKKEIKRLEVLWNNEVYEKNQVSQELLDTQTELFNTQLELKKYKIQCEEYEQQISNYKTEGRYLVKKIPSGRTPNTIKTKISKPMASNVTKYMREEHE